MRLAVCLFFSFAVSSLTASVAPLTVKEVGLMLRSGYSSDVVLQELSKRKFADNLDSNTEQQLIKAGASKSLISTLESGVYQLSPAEIASEQQKQVSHRETVPQSTPVPKTERTSQPPLQTTAQIGGTMYDHLAGDLLYWHEGALVPV